MKIFFGWIAFIVACIKPRIALSADTYSQFTGIGAPPEIRRERAMLRANGWKCRQCGAVNASYTGSCACGMDRKKSDELDDMSQSK